MERLVHPERPEAFIGVWHDLVPHKIRFKILMRCEQIGWHEATILGDEGQQVKDATVRKCQRCYIDSTKLAGILFSKIASELPGAIGLNPRLRVLKYVAGDFFAPHFDASFEMEGQASQKTVLVYLSDSGAATRFVCDSKLDLEVKPRAGDVLVFDHDLLHAGDAVLTGEKYVLRTDVMYAV